MRYVMVIDLKRCVGCQACTVACKQQNNTPPDIFWSRVLVEEKGSFPNAQLSMLPVLCNHCSDAPCYDVCPTGATEKQPDGRITINTEKCIGCRYCMASCPYSARTFNYQAPAAQYAGQDKTPFEKFHRRQHTVGQVGKCNFCSERVLAGLDPKCAETCPAKARIFGDADDPDSLVAKLISRRDAKPLKAELGTGPAVYYLPS